MKRHHTAKKFIAKLPEDFQEVLMASEMELQEGLTVPILRKLVYLYTRGMQYYDLVHKDKFRQFYSDKLVSLLTRKDVEQFLDKNPINFEDKKDLDKLFSVPQNKQTPPQTASNTSQPTTQAPQPQIESGKKEPVKDYNINQYFREFSNKIRRNSTAISRKIEKQEKIKEFVHALDIMAQAKKKKILEEKEEDLKIKKFNLEKDAQEEKLLQEKKRIALEREREAQALREKKEKQKDKLDEVNEARARKAMIE